MAIKNQSSDDDLRRISDTISALAAETRKVLESTKGIRDHVAHTTDELEKQAAVSNRVKQAFKLMSSSLKDTFDKALGSNWKEGIRTVDDFNAALRRVKKTAGERFDILDVDEINREMAKIKAKIQDTSNTQKKTSKTNTKAQKDFNEQLAQTATMLKDVTEVYKKLSQAITEGSQLRVKIDNTGFESVLNEMAKAIERFKDRNGRGKGAPNFFDWEMNDVKGAVKPEIVKTTKDVADSVGEAFNEESVKKAIQESVRKAISEGIISGIKLGAAEGMANVNGAVIAENVGNLTKKLVDAGVKPSSVNYIAEQIFGDEHLDSAQVEKVQIKDAQAKAKASADARVKIAAKSEEEETKRNRDNIEHEEKMEQMRLEEERRREAQANDERVRLLNGNPKEAAKIARAMADIEVSNAGIKIYKDERAKEVADEAVKQGKLTTEMMALEIQQKEANLEKTRDWTSRKQAVMEDWIKTERELQAELNGNAGKELTEVDKVIEHMEELVAKRHDLEMQARDGVRNTAQQKKNFHDMVHAVKQLTEEQYKLNAGYYKQEKELKKAVEQYQKMDRYLQAIGNTISGATRTWNQFGSMIQNVFGRFRNGIMNLFSTGRSQLRTLVTDATEQYSKLERAQIGFTNFFGSEQSKKLIPKIQQEAIAAPSLSSGDLADYVAQLAPVSNGNADLALNATMGILKAIQYSGSDASTEMGRVVANIRDVMSKGMANTIDIRQFNRAMPAIEKALSELGASEFLKDGQLSITKENAKTLMEAFAKLNTDPASPAKNIFKQMGNTTEALQEAWKERRTQMVMNVLKDSGAFDMMKGILTNASNNGLLYKVQDFFTKKIKAIIEWIKSVDWERVGTTFSNGFEKIRNAVVKAYETIMSAIPSVDGWEVIETAFNAIKKAIEGFAQGVKTTINTVQTMFGGVSPEVIENAASVVGFMLSPVQKLFSSIGSIATSVLSFAQNANKTMGQLGANRLKKYQEAVQKAAELQSRIASNHLGDVGQLKAVTSVNIHNQATGKATKTYGEGKNAFTREGYMVGGQFIPTAYYDKMQKYGTFKQETLSQLAKDRYGKDTDQLSFVQLARVKGDYYGGKVSNVWQRTLNTFAEQMGKIVNGGQLMAFGIGVKSMADKTNMAAQLLGSAVESLGIFNISRGVGSAIGGIFGNAQLGGMIGGIAGTALGILNVVNAWYEADRAQKAKEAQEQREKAVNQQVQDIAEAAMETWGLDKAKTEQGKYVWDQLVKELNELAVTDMNTLVGQGKYGNMEETMEHFQTQAKVLANRFDQSNYMEVIDDFMDKDGEELSEKAKAFHAATGKDLSNWTDTGTEEEKEARTWIANMVRELGLLSDAQVGGLLSSATDEKIVETFLEDMNGTINEGQLKMLKEEYEEANKLFPTQMDKVKVQLQENSKASDVLNTTMGKLNTNVETIIEKGLVFYLNGGKPDETTDPGSMTTQDRAAYLSQGSGFWSDLFGGISVGYQQANGKLFDDQTKALFRIQKNWFTDPDNVLDDLREELKNIGLGDDFFKTKFWRGTGPYQSLDKISGLYQMLQRKGDQYKDDSGKMEKIGDAYDILNEKSFVGLSAEGSMKQLADIIKRLWALGDWIFEAHGGRISAFSGRGVDTVPAFLQPGEFVMRRGSVMKAGLGVMSALNRGDLASAARGLGSKLITGGEFNNSRNWSNITNNNQRTNNNVFNIVNRNTSAMTNTYHSLANRIATV